MLESLVWIFVGALIGWHVPQPLWAKAIVQKVKDTIAPKQ